MSRTRTGLWCCWVPGTPASERQWPGGCSHPARTLHCRAPARRWVRWHPELASIDLLLALNSVSGFICKCLVVFPTLFLCYCPGFYLGGTVDSCSSNLGTSWWLLCCLCGECTDAGLYLCRFSVTWRMVTSCYWTGNQHCTSPASWLTRWSGAEH